MRLPWEIYPSTFNIFSVSFGGVDLSPVILSTGTSPSGQSYDVYGVNVASYAGDSGQLEFTSDFSQEVPSLLLDDIAFSKSAVPERGMLPMSAMGGLLFGARQWLTRRC